MEWRVAYSLDVLLNQLDRAFHGRSVRSDGGIGDAAHRATVSDHNPDARGVVRARDFTHDPAAGCDIDRLSDELAASRDPRIKYVIANSLIMSGAAGPRPWQWTAYHGSNPHTKHLHLSVVADARADDTRPWDLPMLRPLEDDMPTPAEIWDHVIPDPYPGAQPKRARDLVGWAATHAAHATEEARATRAELAALKAALPDMVAEEIRAALAEGLVDVAVTVHDRTESTAGDSTT